MREKGYNELAWAGSGSKQARQIDGKGKEEGGGGGGGEERGRRRGCKKKRERKEGTVWLRLRVMCTGPGGLKTKEDALVD